MREFGNMRSVGIEVINQKGIAWTVDFHLWFCWLRVSYEIVKGNLGVRVFVPEGT